MAIFGRKSSTTPSGHRSRAPDTLDVCEVADVDWIKQSGDPLAWHTAALACLIFRGDRHNLLAWLVEQPSLDRATGAAIFLHRSNGLRRLKGEAVEYVQMDGFLVEHLIDRLCALDMERLLPDHGIGLAEGWETERLAVLAALAGNPLAPMRLLGSPINRQTAQMPYLDIGEGELMSQEHVRTTMPFLFD